METGPWFALEARLMWLMDWVGAYQCGCLPAAIISFVTSGETELDLIQTSMMDIFPRSAKQPQDVEQLAHTAPVQHDV